MPTDQQVTAQAVLRAVTQLQRQGPDPAMRHLEQTEPDLAEYVMETLGTIHHRLLALGASTQKTQRLHRQIQSLVLVCIQSLRHAHHELLRERMGERLGQLEPDVDDPQPKIEPPEEQ